MTLLENNRTEKEVSIVRKTGAILLPISIFAISLWLVTWFADGLILRKSNLVSKKKRAALAIRDSVPSFEQFGTELFTDPYLKAYYNKSFYFTQKRKNGQKQLILSSLKSLLQKYDCVDIFLLAHTNRYLYWLEELSPKLLKKIRLVYNTGCHNANQGKRWLKLGADAYIGHKGNTSLSPFFYVYFLRRWASGYVLDEAVKESNGLAKREINLIKDYLPKPKGKLDYIVQTEGHLFGNRGLQIDILIENP